MVILLVHIHVKPEFVDAFRDATLANAANSVQEPGILRFDVIQQQDDPTRFALVEVYRTPEDHAKHRETGHYLHWRDAVADMMAEPRIGVKYNSLFFTDGEGVS